MICLTLHYSAQPNTHHSIEYSENRNLLLDDMQIQLMYMKKNSHCVHLCRFLMVHNLLNLLCI